MENFRGIVAQGSIGIQGVGSGSIGIQGVGSGSMVIQGVVSGSTGAQGGEGEGGTQGVTGSQVKLEDRSVNVNYGFKTKFR